MREGSEIEALDELEPNEESGSGLKGTGVKSGTSGLEDRAEGERARDFEDLGMIGRTIGGADGLAGADGLRAGGRRGEDG